MKSLNSRIRWRIDPWEFVLNISKWVGIVLVIVMATMVATSTIGRYAFGRPLYGVDTYSGYMLLIICVYGAAYLLNQGGHPKVEYIVSKLPPKAAVWIQVVTDFASIVLTALIIFVTIKLSRMAIASGIREMATDLPIAPFQLAMVIGFMLVGIEFVRQFRLSLKGALEKQLAHEPQREC